MADFLSPGVETFEKDRTLNISNVVANATGYVGMFRWGPANEIVRITTHESELVQKFGRPDEATTLYFHSALNFLLYTNPLYVVRTVGTGALNAVADSSPGVLVENESAYENAGATLDGISFIGRYAGDIGNSLLVSVSDDEGFDTWDYANEFDYAPQAGEFNLVVVDEDGFISGNAGTVLERFELLTKTPGDKKPDGTTAYVVKAIQDQSQWILVGDVDAIDFSASSSLGVYETSLQGGADDNDAQNADFNSAWNQFLNSETVDIFRVFTSGSPDAGNAIDVVESRQDAIAFVAPELDDVYNSTTAVEDVKEYFNTTLNRATSYAFNVDNWKMVYDKYRDKNIWIPTDSDAAALHARTMAQTEAWFSPAGFNRGHLKNVIKLAWNPNKEQRNVLYKNGINSIVSFPGEGTVLFGDKTALARPSAFSRINVRSLLIVLKKNIANAAKYQLFELNDEITRSIFRNSVNQHLENVQGRCGLTDYLVVADSTNNTPHVIDSNEFVADIFLKPTRVINYIRLNFIVVNTGVEFSEVEGSE